MAASRMLSPLFRWVRPRTTTCCGSALRDGQLIEVMAETPPVPDAIHAVYPQTRYVSRAVRAVIDMLVAAFDAALPWEDS